MSEPRISWCRRAALGAVVVVVTVSAGIAGSGASTTDVTRPVDGSPSRPSPGATFSFRPWVSANGRYVAFDSSAGLAPGVRRGVRNVYVYHRQSGRLGLVSVGLKGTPSDGDSQRPTLSADGRYVAFWSEATNLVAGDTNGKRDVFVADRMAHTTTRVSVAGDGSQGNGDSYSPCIALTDDGRVLVAFDSAATNLTPGRNDTVKRSAVFVHLDDDPPPTGR